jgi:hypothetical protein
MVMPGRDRSETATECGAFRIKPDGREGLVAETSADSNALAPDGATAVQHGCAGLGLHSRAETMCLHTVAAIGLKCALGHEYALLFPERNLSLDGKFQV